MSTNRQQRRVTPRPCQQLVSCRSRLWAWSVDGDLAAGSDKSFDIRHGAGEVIELSFNRPVGSEENEGHGTDGLASRRGDGDAIGTALQAVARDAAVEVTTVGGGGGL